VSGVLLNGRVPEDWELPAIRRAYDCARERDLEQLAGVLAEARDTWVRPPGPSSSVIELYGEVL